MKQKLNFQISVLIATSIAWSWSPLVDKQPALEHSHGVFGNPAALGSYDGAGWLLSYAPDTANASALRWGIHSENIGFSMDWIHDQDIGLDQTMWHTTLALPSADNQISLGLRGTVWRSSEFRGNAFSATPGVLIHPSKKLSLGWTGEDWISSRKFHKVHRYGIAIRPVEAAILSADLAVNHYQESWYSKSPVFGQADLLLPGFSIGARFPIRNANHEPISMYLSANLGERQSIAVQGTRNHLQSFGLDGHLARSPSPLAPRQWVSLDLSSSISEYKKGFLFLEDDALSLPDLLIQIDHLENDPSVQGIVFNFDGYSGNSAASSEIRRAILQLQARGKFVVAFLPGIRPGMLLAASVADRIVLQPASQIHFRGLSYESLHFKGFLDKIGVKAELIRHGRYKSAVEAFTMDSMSSFARANYDSLMNGLWANLRDSIASGRHMSSSKLDSIATQSPLSPIDAQKLGLVDTILHIDDLAAYLHIPAIANWSNLDRTPYREDWRSKPRIGIVTLDGEIVDGPGNQTPFSTPGIAGKTYSQLVDYLRSAPNISALVLRINSPGGSAQASDMLWHRLRRLGKDLRIPVVASIGGMAASGGYYIACAADEIYAEPTSIVGSIGIFGGKIDASGLMDKLGIQSSIVRTHDKADAERISRGFTDEERQIIQASMDDAYQGFLLAVSEARKMTTSQVDQIGEGQVFTGIQAKQNGLVDEIGGIQDAIRAAARLAGIQPDADLQTYHIHFSGGWNLEQGHLNSLFTKWIESLDRTQVWAMWNGPDYFED